MFVFRFGNDNYRYRYHLSTLCAIIESYRFFSSFDIKPQYVQLCSAGAFEIQEKCGLELFLVVFRMVHPHNAHTRTHTESAVPSCHKKRRPRVRLLFDRGCHNANSLHCDTGTAAATDIICRKNENGPKKLDGTSVLDSVFLIPTAVGSHSDTHALTNPHAEAPFVAVTKGKG